MHCQKSQRSPDSATTRCLGGLNEVIRVTERLSQQVLLSFGSTNVKCSEPINKAKGTDHLAKRVSSGSDSDLIGTICYLLSWVRWSITFTFQWDSGKARIGPSLPIQLPFLRGFRGHIRQIKGCWACH